MHEDLIICEPHIERALKEVVGPRLGVRYLAPFAMVCGIRARSIVLAGRMNKHHRTWVRDVAMVRLIPGGRVTRLSDAEVFTNHPAILRAFAIGE